MHEKITRAELIREVASLVEEEQKLTGIRFDVQFTEVPQKQIPDALSSPGFSKGKCTIYLKTGMSRQVSVYVLSAQIIMAGRAYRGFPEFGQLAEARDPLIASINVAATQLLNMLSIRNRCPIHRIVIEPAIRNIIDFESLGKRIASCEDKINSFLGKYEALKIAGFLAVCPELVSKMISKYAAHSPHGCFSLAQELVAVVENYDVENKEECWDAMRELIRILDLEGKSAIVDRFGDYYFNGRFGKIPKR